MNGQSKPWQIHTTERHPARWGKELLTHTTTWKNFKIIMLSRGNQTQNQVSFFESSGEQTVRSDRKLARGCLRVGWAGAGYPEVADGFLTLTGLKVAQCARSSKLSACALSVQLVMSMMLLKSCF